ncbi:hypothetical protein Lalb_Chr25g0286301 [Lupinus albus]|uniref:Uncharacterized protein n=1 Tax=Lupinus albus TaxID=3870 RepID=A0A6A4NCM8_LUPAL|nr:hypothetical protein Lalb_Chr25g0286301 [Lupinus albus]
MIMKNKNVHQLYPKFIYITIVTLTFYPRIVVRVAPTKMVSEYIHNPLGVAAHADAVWFGEVGAVSFDEDGVVMEPPGLNDDNGAGVAAT